MPLGRATLLQLAKSNSELSNPIKTIIIAVVVFFRDNYCTDGKADNSPRTAQECIFIAELFDS